MKFVAIFKPNPETLAAGPPDEGNIAEMGAFIGEMMSAGVLLDTGGRDADGLSLRVSRNGTKTTVIDGPFAETKEVVGGFAVFRVASKDEAVAMTTKFLAIAGNGTAELHEVSEFG